MTARRHLVKLSYIGTNYRGSQKHANGNNIQDVDSIQGAVEASMHWIWKICEKRPMLNLAGRTDAGVHALCTTGHVDLELKPEITLDVDYTLKMLNRHLINSGHEIRVFSFYEVNPEFHARFSAKSRSYLYRFMIPKTLGNHQIPMAEFSRTLHLHFPTFNIDKLISGTELFKGTKDFRTFSSKAIRDSKNKGDEYKRSFVRTLEINVEKSCALMPFDPHSENFDYYHITFKSRSFLYNQIRRIVGALIALACNRVSKDNIITMLQVPSHNNWNSRITPAMPHGLYLTNVEYDEDLIKPIS